MTTNDFIQQCKNSGRFHWSQMREIYKGFEDSLTIEQVIFYSNPEFEWTQMKAIREDLKNGASIEEVKKKYEL